MMSLIKWFTPAVATIALVTGAAAGEIKRYDQTAFDTLAAQGKPIVVAVHADWCPVCKVQEPIQADLMASPAFKDYTLFNVDFDTEKTVLRGFRVTRQSTMIVFRGSTEVGRSIGDTKKESIEALLLKAKSK